MLKGLIKKCVNNHYKKYSDYIRFMLDLSIY